MNVKEINPLVLAYLGDTIYENYVRRYFISLGISSVKELQEKVIPYVSAKGQAKFLDILLNNDFFDDDECSVIRRARNTKSNSHPKSCDVLTYRHATAFEAVIGYLSLLNKEERIEKIMNCILEEEIC